MHQTNGEIIEISHLTTHKTPFCVRSRANGEISQNAMTLMANEPNCKNKETLEIFLFAHT